MVSLPTLYKVHFSPLDLQTTQHGFFYPHLRGAELEAARLWMTRGLFHMPTSTAYTTALPVALSRPLPLRIARGKEGSSGDGLA